MSGRTDAQATGLTPLTAAQAFGFRGGGGTPSGQPIAQGLTGKFGLNVVALGNVFNLASANKPGTMDLAIYEGQDAFYIYPGDSNFNPADRITVTSSATGTSFGVTIGTGSKYGDLDGDGLAEVSAAGFSDPRTGTGTTVAELFYGDVLAKRAALGPVDTSEGSPLDPPAQSNPDPSAATPGVVEFVGDLNHDGKPDIAIGGPAANGNQGEFTILY
jgi:hypothetical protein